MDRTEFIASGLTALFDEFPGMHKRIDTSSQIDRWFARFGHLSLPVWTQTVSAYADANDRHPTVASLAGCLPKGEGARMGAVRCEHLWEILPDGNQMCHHCGTHHRACVCRWCHCAKVDQHPGAIALKPAGGGQHWYQCPQCQVDFRRRRPLQVT